MSLDLHVKDHPLTCEEVVKKLYTYLDGMLTLEEVSLYREHLELCPPCRGFVEFEAKLIEIIKTKGGKEGLEPIPPGLKEKIMKALELSRS